MSGDGESGGGARRDERGEDGAHLMDVADALPGRFTAETRGDTLVYTKEERGRTLVATVPLSAFDDPDANPPPLVWHLVEPRT